MVVALMSLSMAGMQRTVAVSAPRTYKVYAGLYIYPAEWSYRTSRPLRS